MARPTHWQIWWWYVVEDKWVSSYYIRITALVEECRLTDKHMHAHHSPPVHSNTSHVWVSPYSQPFAHSPFSHTCYKYRLLLVHCYILPLNPRPLLCLTYTTEGESCSDVLLAISLDDIIKSLLPQQPLPVFPWQPAAMLRWCILPHWRGRRQWRPIVSKGAA